MTVQYDGNELYTIHIGHQKIQLSQDEINEIQGWDFYNRLDMSNQVEYLEDENDEMRTLVSKTYDGLVNVTISIDDLLSDNTISHIGLEVQLEKILVINQKLGDI